MKTTPTPKTITIHNIYGSAVKADAGDRPHVYTKTLTLGGALKAFIELNNLAHHAQISAHAAGESNISICKAFCAFLVARDFDATVVVGVGFTKMLVQPCPQLVTAIKETGEAKIAYNLQHAVVCVNTMVLDLCFLRLGSMYMQVNNFSLLEFKRYFRDVRDMKHVMSITPDTARELARSAPGFSVGRKALAAAARIKQCDWYVYSSDVPSFIHSTSGKKMKIVKGEYFSVQQATRRMDIVRCGSAPEHTFKMSATGSAELARKGTAVTDATDNSPKQIKITFTGDSE